MFWSEGDFLRFARRKLAVESRQIHPQGRCIPPLPLLWSAHQDLGGTPTRLRHHLLELLGRDPNGTVQRDASTGEDGGEQVALVAFRIRQETSRLDRSASAA